MKTAQEIFTTVVQHLRKQGKKAVLEDKDWTGKPYCAYRAPDGSKCAVGCLIPDAEYAPGLEGHGIEEVVTYPRHLLTEERVAEFREHAHLLCDLQNIHDHCEVSDWDRALKSTAIRHNLEMPR